MRLVSFTFAALLLPSLAAAARPGRIEPPAHGSAIVLEYSIEPGTVGADQDMTLQLCVTNQNVHSLRDVQPGDAFSFMFNTGTVGACGAVSLFSPDGAFAPDAFACEVLGPVVTLRYDGPHATAWPAGDMACTEVAYHSGASVSNVAATMEIGNRGAFAPASPAFVRLAIGSEAGGGGGGGGGETRMGEIAFLTSTDIVTLRLGDSPELVPGLATTITVRAGSRLEVFADLLGYACLPSPNHAEEQAGASVQVDGWDVASRGWREASHDIVNDEPYVNQPLSLIWMSQPLAAGPHDVRVLAFLPAGNFGNGFCVGTDPSVDPHNQSRVIIHELLAPN
jgi:hypothetical protein